MPLFYQHNINESTKLAVWSIVEAEDFFLKKISLQKEIHHPHKRIQHLAGRYLLQVLDAGFPLHLIEIANSNKPLLPDEEWHFSISHCGDFAAAIISDTKAVGIDVELIKAKIQLIKHKFLSKREQQLLPGSSNQMLTLLWCSKEAVYKWYGNRGVDFINHIHIEQVSITGAHGFVACRFLKNADQLLIIEFRIFEGLCLAWVAG